MKLHTVATGRVAPYGLGEIIATHNARTDRVINQLCRRAEDAGHYLTDDNGNRVHAYDSTGWALITPEYLAHT